MFVGRGDGGKGKRLGYSHVLTSDCGRGSSTRNSDSDWKQDE
jgi:hypothetical protein